MKTHAELERENAKIQAELAQIRHELLRKDSALESKDSLIQSKDSLIQSKNNLNDQLKEALILARNRQFAKATESSRSLQGELFDESEFESSLELPLNEGEANTVDVPRKRSARQSLPEDLPRVEVIHDLRDDEKVCPHDGSALTLIGEKTAEQLDIIPMQIRVIRHIRKQYACTCCQQRGSAFLKTAAKPKQAIDKSQASAGLLAYIAVCKYADSLPLYRQSTILSRFGIEMNRTTLANWMIKCGELIQPLINRFEEQLLSQPFIHMDETPVQVLNEVGKAGASKSYMWVRSAGPPDQRLILFDYDASRGGGVAKKLLADYRGALMADGYEGYEPVCREQGLTRLGCWVHARRKFVDVSKASKKKNSQAAYAIKLIAKLYAIEKAHKESSHDVRHQARLEQAKPIIDKLKCWLDEIKLKVPPKTTLGKAIYYLDHQWPRLVGYLEDGRYPIDNNPVENAIRPFAIGRKNWLFSASVKGAKASANLYSLIETAKANALEPYAYLKHIFTELPKAQSFDEVDQLLPWAVNRDDESR